MKISKGDSTIHISLREMIDVVEYDLIDELIELVVRLEEAEEDFTNKPTDLFNQLKQWQGE